MQGETNLCLKTTLTLTQASTAQQRHESKKALATLEETYRHIGFSGIMHLPYSNIFPVGDNTFLDLEIEGVGTKVLVAELADKYDTIGIDAVAMVVNDVIRSGAKPLAIADNIHATASEPKLVNAWLKGIIEGANESECPIVNGETGDVAEIIKGIKPNSGFDMVVSAVGKVERQDLITGEGIKPGDPIIGLASSGVHSNGITLVRKILFKQWGGKYRRNRHSRRFRAGSGAGSFGTYKNLCQIPPQTRKGSQNQRRSPHHRRCLHQIQQPCRLFKGYRL